MSIRPVVDESSISEMRKRPHLHEYLVICS